MAAFWLLQMADVYTTYDGMKYDCVYEANPLLPSVPHLDRLLIHKVIFLSPLQTLKEEDLLTYDNMFFPMLFSAYVVYNNLKVGDSAKKRCGRR